ncbi:MAG: molybdenum cofactor guanylyltransferase [Roseicyclus sp.]|nr:molybdenum cofactor guanylyltransferase [Roseicyclus sp.]
MQLQDTITPSTVSSVAPSVIPAVILAGGQGLRIGGDKAQVLLAGRPLWRHVYDRVAPQVAAVVVNGVGSFGSMPVIADDVPGQGPLGGVLAAMDWASRQGAKRVMTVAVDTPFLPGDLCARLAMQVGPIVIARTDDGLHATTALWDVSLADDLRAALAAGARKVTAWSETAGYAAVPFPESVPPAFFNVNTREDLEQAEAWLA